MKKILLLIALFPVLSFAEGPRYRHKDTLINQEFENAYQDIRTAKRTANDTSDLLTSGTSGYLLQAVGSGNDPEWNFNLLGGSSGQILTSQGSSATPVFQDSIDIDGTIVSGSSMTATGTITGKTLTPTFNPTGTPEPNAIYKLNVVKGWVNYSGATNNISDSFNVSSITDNGATGDHTINWNRDFGNSSFAVACTSTLQQTLFNANHGLGTSRILTTNSSGTQADTNPVNCIAIGHQQ